MNPTELAILNYFNYFTEIEDVFVRRRGKHLLLSPIDWAMIEGWRERGIPLHVVLRAIESVFDNFDKNPRPRTIKSLVFCREEVEAQYSEWLAARVGAGSAETASVSETMISREAALEHIISVCRALREVRAPELIEDIERSVARLEQLGEGISDDPGATDRSMLDIERFLDEALMLKGESGMRKRIVGEVAAQLKEYRKTMDKESFAQTERLMTLKRLREEYGIPRIGLFYV
ncbi:MAG TPA: hypothetical protein PKD11_06595 [Pyrinomonadaceae bacterium]|nr:hypothetical protein [Pyrinomonadaceae bacterium]